MPHSLIRVAIVVLAVVTAADCRRDERTATVRHIDLLKSIDRAERRPQGGTFTTALVTLGGETQPALDVPAVSRILWTTKLPDDAVLQTALGVPSQVPAARGAKVVFRIGISDDRTYDGLL
jgi:hypothetical protein